MKKTILILGIIAVFFASCKRDEMLEEGDKWHSGHAAVDLGLPSGLYWATCNIGASSPEEDGYFFAWGEVNPKTVSSEENSETNNKNLGDISGDAQYDAARANWGGYWRMPTKYEMQELVEHCSWEKETQNGIEGYRVTGPSGNSIFMAGLHWTSSPYKDAVYISHPPIYNHNEAYMLDVNGDVFSAHRINLNNVRPVFCKSESPQGFDAISESVSHVTSTTANFYAMVMQDEPSIIKTYGVCWSTNARPTIDDDCDTRYEYLDPMNHGNCSYDTHLENLQPNTKYYIRAFATHGDAVVYGEIMSFTTLPAESGQENGLTYIDLGLPSGVKWSMKIFDNTSWGEDGRWKDTYEAGNCITYGMQLGDISGNDDYDLVQMSWGGAWRMPTEYEMRELVEQCSWEWGYHENYGSTLYGYKVTGPNGNSIVIPANGYRGESAYTYESFEKKGYYWTSTPYNDGSNHYAYSLEFDEGNIEVKQNLRYYGYNIIPVIGFNSQIYPTIITEEVTDITCNSAKCEVEIISEGSVDIYAVGAYWGKNPNPKVDDYDGADFDGTASCVVEMSYLEPNTTYYVRAAAHTSLGIIYGEERSFTTLEDVKELPVVTTNEITDVEAGSAICASEVTDDGGGTVSARGVCWSTNQNPTIEDNKTNDGSGTGSYTSKLNNLASQTTYYVRAYATNEMGTAYGKEISFTTLEMTLPVVTTKMASDITSNSALCGGEILSTGGSDIEISGLLWADYPNLTLDSSPLTSDNSGHNIVGSWSKEIKGLWPNTTYYVRAYATNEMGTSYGEEISFTTLGADTFEETISGDENGYSYVDLGLPSGLKWANYNIGASNYKEHGNPYAWGETTTKTEYTASNSVTYRQKVSEFSGNAQYDAATANWGGEWRMPTEAEFEELLNECTWQWLTLQYDDGNYTNGYKVTGPNGNRIFLPETLIYEDNGMAGAGGSYWSSTPPHTNDEQAFYLCLEFGYSAADVYCSSGTLRYEGMSIRPVFGGDFKEPYQSFTVNGVSFTMIAVEGGTFKMGAQSSDSGGDNYDSEANSNESPVHDVTLSSYYIGETEVTQELWEAVMGSNPSEFSGYPQRPVEKVSWNDCQEFITKLNNLTGKNFRLPTEAEWEYAARGGNKSQGYKYSGSNTIGDVSWYTDNSSSTTHDVKTKQANELGIYDMSGNVWECCQDWYVSYSSGSQTNPTGPSSGYSRVFRGSGCDGSAGCCRVSFRDFNNPGITFSGLGLRLSLSQD